MKIIITMNIDSDYADPSHKMGVTEEGFNEITDALMGFGSDIDVRKATDAEVTS